MGRNVLVLSAEDCLLGERHLTQHAPILGRIICHEILIVTILGAPLAWAQACRGEL